MADKAAAKSDAKAEEKPQDAAPQVTDLDLLEEDDEFEEFETDEWDEKEEMKENVKQWEDDWDDDDVSDVFTNQLRAELEKVGTAPMA